MLDYEAEPRRLATHCEFGDYLDQALRDGLVCGIRSDLEHSEASTNRGGFHSYAGGGVSTGNGGDSPEHSIHEGKDRKCNQ